MMLLFIISSSTIHHHIIIHHPSSSSTIHRHIICPLFIIQLHLDIDKSYCKYLQQTQVINIINWLRQSFSFEDHFSAVLIVCSTIPAPLQHGQAHPAKRNLAFRTGHVFAAHLMFNWYLAFRTKPNFRDLYCHIHLFLSIKKRDFLDVLLCKYSVGHNALNIATLLIMIASPWFKTPETKVSEMAFVIGTSHLHRFPMLINYRVLAPWTSFSKVLQPVGSEFFSIVLIFLFGEYQYFAAEGKFYFLVAVGAVYLMFLLINSILQQGLHGLSAESMSACALNHSSLQRNLILQLIEVVDAGYFSQRHLLLHQTVPICQQRHQDVLILQSLPVELQHHLIGPQPVTNLVEDLQLQFSQGQTRIYVHFKSLFSDEQQHNLGNAGRDFFLFQAWLFQQYFWRAFITHLLIIC